MDVTNERFKTDVGISLVLPGYNEEENIEEAVEKCLTTLGSFTNQYEIIIINDASTDRTGELAERLQMQHPAVRVIHNPINLSVGLSVLIGFQAARYPLIVHNAMDLPFDLNDLEKVLLFFPESDVVVVARTDRSAHSSWRKLTSLTNYWLIRLLFRIVVSDFNFVQMYKKEVVDTIQVEAKSPAFVTPELLIRARDKGFKIAEVKIDFHERKKGKASFGKPRDILWSLADMLSFWLERTFNLG